MEAANREERRLMRQRGAGTRKIQEVDFGFSFGPPAAAPPEPPPPPPSPPPPPNRSPQQAEPISSVSRGSLRPDLTPETQQPLAPPPSDRRTSQTKLQSPTARLSSARRSPVSSRNGHTSSSIYDIPPDSPQEPSSSAKRRRIGPSPKDGSIQAIPEKEPAQTNGVGLHEVQNTEPAAKQVQSPEIRQAASLPEATKPPQQSITQAPQLNEPSYSLPSINKDGPDITRQEKTPINNVEEETRAPDTQPDLAESSSKPQEGKARKKPWKRKSIVWNREPRRSSDEINKHRNKAQAQQAPEPEPGPEPAEPEQEQEQESEPEPPEQPQLSSVRRQRKSKSIDEQPEEQEAELAAAVEEREGSGAPEDAPELDGTTSRVPEKKEPKKKRQSALPKKQKRKAARPPSIEQLPEDEDEPDQEVEDVEQERPDKSTPEEPDPGPSREAHNKRKSTKKDTTRASRSLETVQEEQEAQVNNESRRSASPQQAAPRRKARKPRQANSETGSRKGSFPVTVHRLANVSALEAVPEPDRSHEADSSDELAARQKFPSRGGVNPVDVLSQICRETLAKTLSALENGIANENQHARRAEFTRKRKAVVAFGEELEGRLFDMTEVLDSNFSLAMGLRGAKKEMRESRSKLMDIRRQREEIALRMDEVRRKHLEEEKMQTQHNNVNNSLHNLELAIDRDQSHTEPEDRSNPAAGLEFLLRSVADDVSSTSPGSQGGLLNQIKNFNARLEERVNGG